MERVYVLQQLFVCTSENLQLLFAENAAAKLRPLPGVWPEPTSNGLMVLAVAETPLDVAAILLQAVYGDALCPGPRRICQRRYPVMEPLMDVFVRVPALYAQSVISDLHGRHAIRRLTAVEERGWLIRAEAPMRSLLGYGQSLALLAQGTADHWITFNRWEPIESQQQYATVSAESERSSAAQPVLE